MQMIFTEENLDLKYFICGYFSFYTFYYLKRITFKNVYLFWHLAKSKLSLRVCLEKKKESAWRADAHNDGRPWPGAAAMAVCVWAVSLQTCWCPSPNSGSILVQNIPYKQTIILGINTLNQILFWALVIVLFNAKMPPWWTTLTSFAT